MLDTVTLFALAVLFGGMVGFSFLFSPLVFIKLPIETAGPFIRQVFPSYFAAILALFALIAVLAANWIAGLMAVLAALNLWVLMPRINALRDRQLAGDAAAKAQFDLLHRGSVVINFVQIAAAAWLLYALG
ncbi:MAG: DUF4149 domain-containing protein [Pseudomonadota bacterium]